MHDLRGKRIVFVNIRLASFAVIQVSVPVSSQGSKLVAIIGKPSGTDTCSRKKAAVVRTLFSGSVLVLFRIQSPFSQKIVSPFVGRGLSVAVFQQLFRIAVARVIEILNRPVIIETFLYMFLFSLYYIKSIIV